MFRFLILSIALASAARAQGGSAVVTLVMPPPGGEGFTALQSGAALAEGAASAYYNPAALAELHRSTGSSLGAAYSRQELLPILHLPDLYQDFQAADLVFADPVGGTDLGVGMYRNHVGFGKNTRTDASGNPMESFESEETVWGLATGVRLGFWLSLGVAAKFIDSRLAQGTGGPSPEDGIARSWAFDFGVLAMPRFRAPEGFPIPLSFAPSAAITLANAGPDVFYVEASQSDPIPSTLTGALGLSAEAWDLVSLTAHAQASQEWTRRSDRLSPIYQTGILGRIFCVEAGVAYLDDRSGKRRERHTSAALVYDWAAQSRVLERIRKGDWTGPSDPAMPASAYWKPFGAKVPLRPRATLGLRGIAEIERNVREGQTAWYLSLSL